MKLLGKILLFLLIAIAAIFLINKYFFDDEPDNTEVFGNSSNIANEGSNDATVDTKEVPVVTKLEQRTFDYTPDRPVNGKLKGVVEMGAAGFNSFVINMDQEKRWEIVSKDFGESLAYEGLATADDIRTGLKKYLTGMFDKGVLKNDMHFVISSGAQKEPKTALISKELKKFNYVVNAVTAEKEGKLAFKATVPTAYQDNSFLVDIGSGTTKITWKQGDKLNSLEMPGSKYFEKGMSDAAVYAEVKAKAGRVPEGKRNVCFILGGVPFTLAKESRKGEARYTVLKSADKYSGKKEKKTEAGLNIYGAITEATKCKTFVFDWDSNFTIGFLLSLK